MVDMNIDILIGSVKDIVFVHKLIDYIFIIAYNGYKESKESKEMSV